MTLENPASSRNLLPIFFVCRQIQEKIDNMQQPAMAHFVENVKFYSVLQWNKPKLWSVSPQSFLFSIWPGYFADLATECVPQPTFSVFTALYVQNDVWIQHDDDNLYATKFFPRSGEKAFLKIEMWVSMK